MKKPKKQGKTQAGAKSSSFALVPLADRIIVREEKVLEGKKTDSGIYIPDSVKEDQGMKRGKVVAVGAGKIEDGKRVPLEVVVGDTILFHWGERAVVNGEEYYIVREGEIAAKIR